MHETMLDPGSRSSDPDSWIIDEAHAIPRTFDYHFQPCMARRRLLGPRDHARRPHLPARAGTFSRRQVDETPRRSLLIGLRHQACRLQVARNGCAAFGTAFGRLREADGLQRRRPQCRRSQRILVSAHLEANALLLRRHHLQPGHGGGAALHFEPGSSAGITSSVALDRDPSRAPVPCRSWWVEGRRRDPGHRREAIEGGRLATGNHSLHPGPS